LYLFNAWHSSEPSQDCDDYWYSALTVDLYCCGRFEKVGGVYAGSSSIKYIIDPVVVTEAAGIYSMVILL
jgi:hypothetical protein